MGNVYLPITVDHIARIEGKAGIEIVIGGHEVRLNVTEGPRFFEAITLGKRLEEALAVYPRICSFCSAAHKLTAVDAAEKAMNFEPREEIQALREALYIGDTIESHALHLYLLVLPDYLGHSGPLHMVDKYKREMGIALDLKNLGSWMMDELGSRAIHQENVVLGGFGKLPGKETLEKMKDKLKEALPKAEYTFQLFARLEQYEEVEGPITHLAVKPRGPYGIYGDYIKTSTGEEFPSGEYRKHIREFVVEHSFAKHSHYHGKPFMVGAISRVVNNLYGKAKELYESHRELLRPTNPFANNLAQALELVYFIERAIDLLDEALARWPIRPRDEVTVKDGFGVSTTEAPRGVLVYALEVKDGRIAYVDIITPTAFNLAMMEEHVRMMVEKHREDDPGEIKRLAEMVVRAYDPCISCSVHVARLGEKV